MDFDDLKRDVIDPGLCMRCGGCSASCPVDAISFTSRGMELSGDCIACGNCVNICPGKGMDFSSYEKELFGSSRKTPLGTRLGIYRSKRDLTAADKEVMRSGYFGGRVSAVLINALEKKMIDAALLTDWSGPGSLSIGEGKIARTKEEVLRFASSKYVFSPVLELLKEIERDDTLERAALVGLPCHVQAFRSMEKHPPTAHLTENVRYVISLNCGAANADENGWKRIVSGLTGVPEAEVLDVRVRKITGSVVEFKVWKTDGSIQTRAFPVSRYLGAIVKVGVWNRCMMCPDYSGFLSDLSFGMPYVRTKRGEELVRSALKEGRLRRSSFRKRISQTFTDIGAPLRKRFRTRLNIWKRKREERPYPVYR